MNFILSLKIKLCDVYNGCVSKQNSVKCKESAKKMKRIYKESERQKWKSEKQVQSIRSVQLSKKKQREITKDTERDGKGKRGTGRNGGREKQKETEREMRGIKRKR